MIAEFPKTAAKTTVERPTGFRQAVLRERLRSRNRSRPIGCPLIARKASDPRRLVTSGARREWWSPRLARPDDLARSPGPLSSMSPADG
ncbi:hypothetical protein UA74_07720 [Actinoalloteichus fjordicus]|uniref:Uncharacterized protein n=1 Tax=Actinoalloteichus fjordicus TaxID=1612552 RepID=A0AAC9PR09_9PSEU|nr:hypothetical protein UA74_07720 [Actinoalloteichus fjordicus]